MPNLTATWQPERQFPFCLEWLAFLVSIQNVRYFKTLSSMSHLFTASKIWRGLAKNWSPPSFYLLPPQSLLSVHDTVAQRDFEPTLPPIPDDVLDEDEDSVKIVSLVKTKEPLVSKNVFMLLKVPVKTLFISCMAQVIWHTGSLAKS